MISRRAFTLASPAAYPRRATVSARGGAERLARGLAPPIGVVMWRRAIGAVGAFRAARLWSGRRRRRRASPRRRWTRAKRGLRRRRCCTGGGHEVRGMFRGGHEGAQRHPGRVACGGKPRDRDCRRGVLGRWGATASRRRLSGTRRSPWPRPVGRPPQRRRRSRQKARREEEMERTKWDLYKAWGLTALCLATHTTHHLHHLGLHEYAHGRKCSPRSASRGSGRPSPCARARGPRRRDHARGVPRHVHGRAEHELARGRRAPRGVALSVAGALTPPVVGEYGIPVNNDFFEEPVLLLAFILLGRALDARARARAASDLRSLSTSSTGRDARGGTAKKTQRLGTRRPTGPDDGDGGPPRAAEGIWCAWFRARSSRSTVRSCHRRSGGGRGDADGRALLVCQRLGRRRLCRDGRVRGTAGRPRDRRGVTVASRAASHGRSLTHRLAPRPCSASRMPSRGPSCTR